MIDINELREAIQTFGSQAINEGDLNELLDRLELAEKEVAHIKEVEFPRKALAVTIGWKTKCARLEQERDALQAKIKAMEPQEPQAEWFSWLPEGASHIDKIRTVLIPNYGCKAWFSAFKYVDGVLYTFRSDSDNEYERWIKAAPLYREGMAPKVYPLHKTPDAQPAPSVPEGISRVSPDFYWDSAKQHHIPTVLVEFEPVPVGSPNDAKGWQDRDRFAALTSGAKGE